MTLREWLEMHGGINKVAMHEFLGRTLERDVTPYLVSSEETGYLQVSCGGRCIIGFKFTDSITRRPMYLVVHEPTNDRPCHPFLELVQSA